MKKDLKLLVKPDSSKPFNKQDFVWATDDEVAEYKKKGYVRVKDLP